MSLVPVASDQAGTSCADCGAPLVADQRYCLSCGQPASPVRLAFLDVLQGQPGTVGALAQTISMGNSLVANAVAVGGGYVWVTDFSSGRVVRYDEKTQQVLPPIDINGDTTRLAVGPYGDAK